jgi:hypothetical protein
MIMEFQGNPEYLSKQPVVVIAFQRLVILVQDGYHPAPLNGQKNIRPIRVITAPVLRAPERLSKEEMISTCMRSEALAEPLRISVGATKRPCLWLACPLPADAALR